MHLTLRDSNDLVFYLTLLIALKQNVPNNLGGAAIAGETEKRILSVTREDFVITIRGLDILSEQGGHREPFGYTTLEGVLRGDAAAVGISHDLHRIPGI